MNVHKALSESLTYTCSILTFLRQSQKLRNYHPPVLSSWQSRKTPQLIYNLLVDSASTLSDQANTHSSVLGTHLESAAVSWSWTWAAYDLSPGLHFQVIETFMCFGQQRSEGRTWQSLWINQIAKAGSPTWPLQISLLHLWNRANPGVLYFTFHFLYPLIQ